MSDSLNSAAISGQRTGSGNATVLEAVTLTTTLTATVPGSKVDPLGDVVTVQAVTGNFANGVLSTFGDNLDNNVAISRNAAGQLLLNGGAVPVVGGTATVANTTLIQAFGLGGNDTITLSEANGALPRANLFGGAGNDVLTGGSGADQLFGQAGNDTLLGRGGNDFLFGGTENDVLVGGDGDDQMFGESGDDRLVWNPGDDSDLFEGGAGMDTAEVNGGNGAENFTVTANGTRVRIDRLDPAPFAIDAGTMENVVINMNGGDDQFSATGNLAALVRLTIDGGTGNDTIRGGNGADTLLGGDGNDFIDGNQGNDVALMGAGNDRFVWNPGDGSDVVEGQAGTDTMQFDGSAANENFELSANGGRLRFTRDIANIVMDTNDLETVEVNALGGADRITVNDLSGTDVTDVRVDLAAVGGAGDAQADTVVAHATNGADNLSLASGAGAVVVQGLAARVHVTNAEAALDRLQLNLLGGDDVLNASGLPNGALGLRADGGAGNDVLTGSAAADELLGGDGIDTLAGALGNDTLRGGNGNDVLTGGDGDDQMFGDDGNDRLVWNPGDDSDVFEGGAGTDTAEVNGGNGAESFTVTANGTRVRVDRLDPAPFAIDAGTMENVVIHMNGGDDRFSATGNLGALVSLTIDGGTGNDTILGGNGADLLLGGDGNDFIDGNQGNDVALMGAGNDRFVWNPGDGSDVVEGQAGTDTMQFDGSAANENFELSANGGRLRFTRDIASITMDTDDVEVVELNALAGADRVTVNNLAGTDVRNVYVNLSGTLGSIAGDAQPDTVAVAGTDGKDVVSLSSVAATTGAVAVQGLAARVQVTGADAQDRLQLNLLGGNDVFDGGGLPLGTLGLVVDGGAGADTLTGSAAADELRGGADEDRLIGGTGADTLRGGNGDDVLTGGDGDDQMFGDDGSDLLVWNPGDDSDLFEGGAGTDTAQVNGGNGAETFTLTANGSRVRIDRLDPAPFSVDAGTVEDVVINLNGGDDSFSAAGNIAALVRLTVDGGTGNDRILGGNGADTLLGGEGNDFIDGNQGNDVALMGAGNDRFVWNPGDGSDVVEGQAGTDTMQFDGSAANENFELSANGGRLRFTRDIANITMDTDDVEVVELNALAGSDRIVVNDLSGTDVRSVRIDLAGALGGTAGDGQADEVVINGTAGRDVVTVSLQNGTVVISGLTTEVVIHHFDAGLDRLVFNGLGGNDAVSASGLAAGTVQLTLNGGAGDDRLAGSPGNDVLDGGPGIDTLIGGGGVDTLLNGEVSLLGVASGATSAPDAALFFG